MSTIIEAQAYAQDFQAEDMAITNSNAQFGALIGFLFVMIIAALAGVVFAAPVVTIAAGLIVAVTVPTVAYMTIGSDL
ncbi:hypothetical protein [Leclercia adecarboxylata]|uniref:hypothetical protein n=1 Tax=Leclercia adecarboxylata TaxID=83655 RepID=UPI00234D54BE|nr:hypothetical protein [Leclercia adecarboxylata]MDC6711279.1 hypothetical protein [Leclercia adecarboxylata]